MISINLSDGNLAGETRTRGEIAASLSAVNVIFSLDAVPLSTTRTPIRPSLALAGVLADALGFTEGKVVGPEDVSVGTHTLGIVISDPSGIIDTSQISFVIDPDGEGTCL